MAEYIEREKAINKRRRVTEYDEAGFSVTYSGVPVEEINNIPAADVVEVVHGRWEEADDGDGVVCSVCGEDFCTIIHETNRFKYCPNCGARMDGEKDV